MRHPAISGDASVGDGQDTAIALFAGLPAVRRTGQAFVSAIARLPWVLILLCSLVTALVSIIGLEVVHWCAPAAASVAIAPGEDPIEGDRGGVPDGRDYQAPLLGEILARPLFTPGRQGAAGGVQGLPRLTGIIVAGSQRLAMFSPRSGRPVVVKAGGYFGDYEVQSISERGVVVGGPRGKLLLTPSFAPVAPPDPPAMAAFPDPLERVPPSRLISR